MSLSRAGKSPLLIVSDGGPVDDGVLIPGAEDLLVEPPEDCDHLSFPRLKPSSTPGQEHSLNLGRDSREIPYRLTENGICPRRLW